MKTLNCKPWNYQCGGKCQSKSLQCKQKISVDNAKNLSQLFKMIGRQIGDSGLSASNKRIVNEKVDSLNIVIPKPESKIPVEEKPKADHNWVQGGDGIREKNNNLRDALRVSETEANSVRKSIDGWSGSKYTLFKEFQRDPGNQQWVDHPAWKFEMKDIQTGLDTLFKNAPAYDGKIYRGLSFKSTEERDGFLSQIKNNELELDSVSSFSSSKTVAEKFSGKKHRNRENLVIEVANNRSGVSIQNLQGFGQEQEVIADKGTRYRVLSQKTKGKRTTIRVEEV